MKIIVTGGAGFIGGNFVHYMLRKHQDYEIICLDALTYAGNMETLVDVMNNPNFTFIKGNICDRDAVFELFEKEKPDMVVNFAAESHVDRSIENPGIFLQTNIIGTGVLMDACRKYRITRYHQVSTDEVYGDLPLNRIDLFFTEETPLHTSSPYSASKASADLLVQAYYRTFHLPVTISRCSNNYGPYHFPEKLIPLMIANALNGKPLPVYGKGENVRDWLYVEDHCCAIDLIIHKGRMGEIYNIGGHNERTNLQVVKTILKELGKHESLIQFVADRPGHDRRYAIDPTKIYSELGWLPETKFDVGIKKTVKWYMDYEKLVGAKLGWSRVPAGKRASTYAIPEYKKAAAAFGDITLKSIEEAQPTDPGVQPRPTVGVQFVDIPEFTDLGTKVSQSISAVLAGKGTVEQALADGQKLAAQVATKYAGK